MLTIDYFFLQVSFDFLVYLRCNSKFQLGEFCAHFAKKTPNVRLRQFDYEARITHPPPHQMKYWPVLDTLVWIWDFGFLVLSC